MHSRWRRRATRIRALVALVIVFVILGGGAGTSVFAYRNVRAQATDLQWELTARLQTAQGELELAKANLKSANASHDRAFLSQATVHFTTAKLQFMVTRQVADNSVLLNRMEAVPTLAEAARSRHVAVDAIADMGVAISDAGLELTQLDELLIKPAAAGGQEGRTLLSVLDQSTNGLVRVRADLTRAQAAAAQVDIKVLPASQQTTFVKARDTIGSALVGLEEFERLVPVLKEILGGNGPRTYLIEQVNPAELRPGGGFIGTFSILRADRGSLKLITSGSAYSITDPRPLIGQRGYVTPPGPLLETLLYNTSWSFMDSNFFPDFASSARAAEDFVQARLGYPIDAVISMDYYTVSEMLRLTGPMALPGFGFTADYQNIIPELLRGAINIDERHKVLLSAIAGPLMDRVATLPPEKWPTLIGMLNGLASARHLQTYFNNATVQKELDRVGWSGTLNPAGVSDFMMEVESNLGATKANYWLTRNFNVELTRNGSTLHHRVLIDLINNMPYDYRPVEYYHAYLRLYVSGSASGFANNLGRVKYPNPANPAGLAMSDGWVPLFHGYGHQATAVFEYDTPWHPDAKGVSQVYWQKQAGTVNDQINVTWKDGSGHTFKAAGNLGQDRVITLGPDSVTLTPGQAAQAQLPSLSLG